LTALGRVMMTRSTRAMNMSGSIANGAFQHFASLELLRGRSRWQELATEVVSSKSERVFFPTRHR
jgi:hypothetical protein